MTESAHSARLARVADDWPSAQPSRIEDMVVEALHDARESNYHDGVIDCLVMLGGTHAENGKLRTARTIAHHALSRARERDDAGRAIAALELLARIDAEEGNHTDAVGRLLEAVGASAPPSHRLLVALAENYKACGDFDGARQQLFAAREQAMREGDPESVIEIDLQLSDIERLRRQPEAAESRLSAALALAVDQGRVSTEVRCRLVAARACIRRNDHPGALHHIRRSEQLLDTASASAIVDTALLYAAVGDLVGAARVIERIDDLTGESTTVIEHHNLVRHQTSGIATTTTTIQLDVRHPVDVDELAG